MRLSIVGLWLFAIVGPDPFVFAQNTPLVYVAPIALPGFRPAGLAQPEVEINPHGIKNFEEKVKRGLILGYYPFVVR